MLTFIIVTAATYAALTAAYGAVMLRTRKVGGIHFARFGRHQFSYCRCKAAPAVPAERLARAAQSREARRLDAIAAKWVNG